MLPAYRYPEYYTQKGQPKGLLKGRRLLNLQAPRCLSIPLMNLMIFCPKMFINLNQQKTGQLFWKCLQKTIYRPIATWIILKNLILVIFAS